MPPESRKYLWDMQQAARAIATFVANKTISDSNSEGLLQGGVCFQLLILGQALGQLHAHDPESAQKISNCQRIIRFRDQMKIEGYAKIDDDITWEFAKEKVTVLLEELELLLASCIAKLIQPLPNS